MRYTTEQKLLNETPVFPIYHNAGTKQESKDKRYSIRREFCGHETPRFVARYCGDWLGDSLSLSGAVLIATNHRTETLRTMGIS